MYIISQIIVASVISVCISKSVKNQWMEVEPYNASQLQQDFGGMFHHALYDVTKGFPANRLTIVYDISTGYISSSGLFLTHLSEHLMRNGISITLYNITAVQQQDVYFSYLTDQIKNHDDLYTIYFCTNKMAEHILIEIYENNLIRRNAIYMFYWGDRPMYRYFIRNLHIAMKIVLFTNPRQNVYRIYYNQATSHKKHHLTMYNWWIDGRGLFHHPTLPKAKRIFRNFNGRVIDVPVIHKPPWHFVHYTNDSLEVIGGRDDKLLRLISKKLNFGYEYFDPPERIQGSSFNINGTFEGVLGLLWERVMYNEEDGRYFFRAVYLEVEFFIGDVALTQERLNAVEFSFLTLADSGAFVTHAPSKLNEALALIRPFNWQVWPAIIMTVLLSGPVLYILIALPNAWQPRFIVSDQVKLFFDCSWYTTGVFFKQSGKAPSDSHKCRFFIILLAISATYVIGDMYAANLTSLLARPGREKPVHNLAQLEEAMELRGYKLLVERHSSSFSLLENGTGIYGKLWELMTSNMMTDSSKYLVDSVEKGVKRVRDATHIALMAGRETLYFDIQRFGASNFHLSEKLNTAYSAVALQLGCPYKENIDEILMSIFEAGILTKMTQDEYENLEKQQSSKGEDDEENDSKDESEEVGQVGRKRKENDEEQKLQPINIRMLQGAFYLLGIGHATAGLIFSLELMYSRHDTLVMKKKKQRAENVNKIKTFFLGSIMKGVYYVRSRFREAMNDAIVSTLEYTE